MPAPKRNKALAAVRAVEAKRKPASKRPSRPSGGGFGGWETVEEFGDWRLPVLRPTRPCPQCGSEATPERGRDNSLGSYWTCTGGHSFAVAPMDARLASCVEQVEIVTAKGAKRSAPCTAKLRSLGPFLVCPKHQRAVWPLVEDASPITLCEDGEKIATRLARFVVEAGDRWALRDGEVPFGYTDEEWAERLAGLEPDAAGTAPVEPPADLGAGGVETPCPEEPLVVTPAEDDEPVPASPTLTAPRPALATALAARAAPADSEERLFPVAEVPVEVKRKKVDALSPSSATVLHQCPRRFEETKILGRQEPVGRAATLGKFVHKILELLTDHPLPKRTEDTARRIARRLWADVDRDPDAPVEYGEADEGDVRELRRDRVELAREVADVGAWVRQFKSESWAALAFAVSIEEAYGGEVAYREMNLWNTTVAGVPFRGYADRIDRHSSPTRDGLVVVDYKSGSPTAVLDKRTGQIDQRKLDEKGEQLSWYAGPVEQKTGERVIGALLAYIGQNAQIVLWVDDAKRAQAEAKLQRLWRDLGRFELAAREKGERYPAREGYLCGWCPFFEDCQPGSAWLLSEFAATWMQKREARGEPTPPAMVEVQSWPRERRQAWWEMARSA